MVAEFELYVQKQVQDFLQNVLLIDDEALRRAEVHGDDGAKWIEQGPRLPSGHLPRLRTPQQLPRPDELDIQQVSRSFAELGLSCAVLSPQTIRENEELEPAFVKTARRADALILDWNLNGDGGKTVKKLVRTVLGEDEESCRRRLRLIVVYTGESDLSDIAHRLFSITTELIKGHVGQWDTDSKVAFTHGPVRISVFCKEHVHNLAPALERYRCKIQELPGLVIEEFGRLSMGLVTSAALAALAGLRNDGHRLLAALGPELDAAVLGQRVALSNPDDIQRQVETLIGAELLAIVQEHEIGSRLGMDPIRMWLLYHEEIGPQGIFQIEEVTKELRLSFLLNGLSDPGIISRTSVRLSGKQIKAIQKDAAGLFSVNELSRDHSNNHFSMRMCMRSVYSKPSPTLRLGSVICRKGLYAVCVQPLCDSVRIIDLSKRFPLIPLEVYEENREKTGDLLITIRDEERNEGFVHLRVRATPSAVRMEEFKVSGKVVRAKRRNRQLRFETSSGETWRWVGDLQPAFAQRVVERLASNFSRIGVDEAEFLRLSLKRANG
ncbi:MAG: response regulator receiver domain [Propionibacteriaceae bacterium]|nr:response regulator receiver domain [Propionibacteriaceae bacterium]